MTSNPITLDKKYQTRDGRPARVHATDMQGPYNVLSTYKNLAGEWVTAHRLSDGRASLDDEHPLDLIEKPKTHKIVGYVNVYPNGDPAFHICKGSADGFASKTRIACKRVDLEVVEGEFDE